MDGVGLPVLIQTQKQKELDVKMSAGQGRSSLSHTWFHFTYRLISKQLNFVHVLWDDVLTVGKRGDLATLCQSEKGKGLTEPDKKKWETRKRKREISLRKGELIQTGNMGRRMGNRTDNRTSWTEIKQRG